MFRAGLLFLLTGGAGLFVRRWVAEARCREIGRPSPRELLVGFVTDFFDTLGIGSFAPTTSLFRLLKLVPVELIPGTMMIGHALPTVAQALIYITIIEVDPSSLLLLIGAAVVGGWFGAGLVAGLPRRPIQRGMGLALIVASAIMAAGMLGWIPAGGERLGLSGARLVVGCAGNAAFAALMSIGIGAYAPSLILFALLGMNVKSIFPIMMGSCAFLMPAAGARFLAAARYSRTAALGLTLGGVPGVLLAAFLVRELPLDVLRWFVLGVVLYTAQSMLRATEEGESPPPAVAPRS